MTQAQTASSAHSVDRGSAKWSYTSGTSDTPLLGMTIGDALDSTTARFPDREALISRHQGLRYTWTELRDEVNRFARALMALGIRKGDRVGIWAPNCAEWTITQFACAKAGAILVNINPAYRLHELEYALNQSGCNTLVVAPNFRATSYLDMLLTLCPELERCAPGQLDAHKAPSLRHVIRLGEQRTAGMWVWSEVMERAKEVSPEALAQRQSEQEFDDPANIQYTSGTTGNPKGATLSHHNILNNGYLVARLQGFTERDRLCVPVPLYHCFGCVMANLGCMTHGATIVYPAEAFDAKAVLDTVQAERCTALYGVPTMFIGELAHPDFDTYDLSTLRTGVMAGSPCPTEVMKQVIDKMHMREVEICYGMTETSPVSFQTRLNDPVEKRVATVGQVSPHTEVKLIDPATGQVVPVGEAGELLTRGYCVMLGYWNNEEATRNAIDQARWMHTGDLATMDDEGYVNIVGRLKDMVIRGGENVYPREIEEFLYQHPKVSDVQVIGVPDAKYGEELMAWVKLKEGQSATAEEMQDFCRGQIATFKIPRYWKFVDAFPMTVTGKIQKFLMRQESIQELGLQNAARIQTA
ncbi:MAG: long-chain-fatty-acid--CoA ligase [Ktedonobacterales bacterium]|jgi:fatty-acyl-CoA synthase|nr:MAG: long-chain-fatty-acid--CoA ligase [Ktedonobacterales bacterium]